MTVDEAKQKVGVVVAARDSEIWGTLEYVTADGWAGVRELPPLGSKKAKRLDEIQASRLFTA